MNALEKLRSRKQVLKEKFGDKLYRVDRLSSLTLSSDLLQEIEDCILSEETLHILEGFNFLRGLVIGRDISVIPTEFLNHLAEAIPALLKNNSKSVVYAALEWYVKLKARYPNYRDVMLSLLNSNDVGEREYALNYYETYALPGEYEPLLTFKNDKHACQMGHASDWEYELRNKAFLLIEKVSGMEAKKVSIKEPFEGATVSWYDWKFLAV